MEARFFDALTKHVELQQKKYEQELTAIQDKILNVMATSVSDTIRVSFDNPSEITSEKLTTWLDKCGVDVKYAQFTEKRGIVTLTFPISHKLIFMAENHLKTKSSEASSISNTR